MARSIKVILRLHCNVQGALKSYKMVKLLNLFYAVHTDALLGGYFEIML